jgi:hypothetical protein
VPERFFNDLPAALADAPPLLGEEARYAQVLAVVEAASSDPKLKEAMAKATEVDARINTPLFEFRNFGYVLPALASGYSSTDLGFRVTVIGEAEIKDTTDSAGIETPLFPVAAAPTVPAPAPTRPPITAPLPPPASPPISAPPPAPPPTIAAVRLPLPLTVCSYSWVVTSYEPTRLSCIPS